MAKWAALLVFLGWGWQFASSQSVDLSPIDKTVAKYDDYEILGRNSIGTVVHYYSKGDHHKLQVYNSKLRPFNELELHIDEKRSAMERVLLGQDHILVFYSTIEGDREYLKVKRVSYRLDAGRPGVVLDSILRSAVNSYNGYYIKPSRNNQYYVAFTYDERNNRLQLHYTLMDHSLKVLRTGDIWTEDKSNMTLESVKVNNHGDLLVVVGHLHKRGADDDEFSFDKFTVHFLARESEVPHRLELTEERYMFKDLLTNWDEQNRSAVIVGTYRKARENEDVGVFYTTLSADGNSIGYGKNPFQEEDFSGSNAPFRKWQDNAEIQIPKRVIPRSDGGFVYITEAEHHDYQLVATSAGTSAGYPYYPEYLNYYDENYYYDLIAVSVDPEGDVRWRIGMPKVQETENDQGRHSSFLYFGSNNVAKLLFVDDIYGNGNLTEFTFNPNGQWNRQVLLNCYREDLLLLPQKGVQVSGTEVIIPSEKKNRLRLIKISY